MSDMASRTVLDPDRGVLEQLRERVARIESGHVGTGPAGPARASVATHPALAAALPLHAGCSYGVDSASLALALAAGASQAGEWVGFAGWPDFGAEAAVALGVDLRRTVLVPDLGEHWLEVTAALVDVLRVVVLRAPGGVDARTAERIDARLRTRSGVLVVWGPWPRCEARVSLEHGAWSGPDHGHGRLRTRRAQLVVRRGATAPERTDVWFPSAGAPLVAVEPPAADETTTPLRSLPA